MEEAIENGLAEMQVERALVDVEVVEKPSSGFLGFKSAKAVVRLTLKHTAKVRSEPSHIGVVGVKHGKLEYTPPLSPDGIVPTIRFGSELHVLYNGVEVEREIKLTEGLEPLEILLPENREPELTYEIEVDTKKTTANLVWKRTPGVEYCLADQAATNQLKLSLSKDLIPAPVLTPTDIEHLIQIKGLKYGLQTDGLTEETLAQSQGKYLLAKGTEPKATQQPTIRYVFQEDTNHFDVDALRIDHYEAHGTEGIKEGTVLAIKQPGSPAISGRDVFGEIIEGEPIREIEFSLGEGVKLSDDGLQVIAMVSGLPSLQSGVIRVTNVFELQGDADVSTGNITMDGDIIIKGNVTENVKVQSNNGVILVNGLVSGGILRTGGSITVLKNVVRAELYAGGTSVIQIRLLNLLRKISGQLEALAVAYHAIVSQADNVPFENLVRHLIELKFSSLPKDIKELADELEGIKSGSEEDALKYTGLLKMMDNCVLVQGSNSLRINDEEQLNDIRQIVKARIAEFEGADTTDSNVKVGYLQNSKVEASGSIEVTGKGCFYSTLMAGKDFTISNGVFRGGQVTVDSGAITAKELGGPKGITTSAFILQKGRIAANLVHPNVSVGIGGQSYKFDEATSMIKVYLQDNILTIYSGSNKIHG